MSETDDTHRVTPAANPPLAWRIVTKLCLCASVTLVTFVAIRRFQHGELTETQLFLRWWAPCVAVLALVTVALFAAWRAEQTETSA